MPTLVNLTGNIADLVGTDFDARRAKVWVTTNLPGDVLIDATGNEVRLGDAYATVTDTGTFTFTGLWATNSATNPTAFQYQLHIDYPKRSADRGRKVWDSGWFDLTATADIADVAQGQYVPPTWMTTATGTLQGYVDEGRVLRDEQVDISNISTSDSVVEALVKNTGGAGPLTSAALSATYASTVAVSATTSELGAAVASAIATLPASGGEVFVPRASYTLTTRFDVPADVTVRFQKGSLVTVPTANVVGVARLTGNRAVVKGLRVAGNGAAKATDAICVEIATGLADCKAIGIKANDWRGDVVTGKSLVRPSILWCDGENIVRSTTGGGLVRLTWDTATNGDTLDPLVAFCTTKTTAGTAIQMDGDWNRLDWRTAGAKVRRGRVIGCHTEGSSWAGVFINSGVGCTVSATTSRANSDYGIGFEFSRDSSITGSTSDGNLIGFALLLKNVGCTVTGNTAVGNTSHGVYVDNNTGALPGDTASSDNVVSGNTARNNGGYGLAIEGGPLRTVVGSNVLQDNTLGPYNNGGTDTRDSATGVPFAPRLPGGAATWFGPPAGRSTAAHPDGTLTAYPFFLAAPARISYLAVDVTTAGAAGSVVRMGIYRDAGGYPDALVYDAGTVATATTGNKQINLAATQSLAPGAYWLAAAPQGGVAVPTLTTATASGGLVNYSTAANALSGLVAYYGTAIGALPASFASVLVAPTAQPFAIAAAAS